MAESVDSEDERSLSFSYCNGKKNKVRTESNCFNDITQNKRVSVSPANANLILQYISTEFKIM